MSSPKQLTIGIMGCARIAKKNCCAATTASCQIAAFASRGEQKGQDFINEVLSDHQEAPLLFSGEDAYMKMLGSDDISSVYIPLPTKLHEQYVAKALSSNKHVLLEKPVAVSAKSYSEMLQAASDNGKFLMDGTLFVHHPRTLAFVKSVPNPNRVHFNFTFDGSGSDFFKNDIRMKKDGDFMGCIGDLGWYCVRMGLLVFSSGDAGALKNLVTEVQVTRYQLNDEGVPFDADCLVHFSGGRVLSIHCSFIHPLNQTVQVSGTGAEYTATMTDAILPRPGNKLSFSLVNQGIIQYDQVTTEETKVMEYDNTDVQEVCMWKNFANMTRKIEEESSLASASAIDVNNEKWWAGDSTEVKEANAIASYSLHTQIVLDALMESIRLDGAKVRVHPLPSS